MPKKTNTFTPEEVSKNLTPKQELFCLLYTLDKECFGNASLSYFRAYDLKESQRRVARQCGYNLLTSTYIRQYTDHLLKKRYTHKDVDARHAQLIFQDKNLIVALGALQEYNKLKKRLEESPLGKIEFSWKENPRKLAAKTTENTEQATRPKTPKGKFTIEINK